MSLRDLSVADWARMDDGAARHECAFRNPYDSPIKPDENIADDYHRVRRVISID
jgi:hypothetical protein